MIFKKGKDGKKKVSLTTKLCLFFVMLWAGGYIGFQNAISDMGKDAPDSVKSLVVLTGGPKRVDRAFDMLNSGDVHEVFVSGVGEGVTTEELLNHWRPVRLEDPCCITLGDAQNTRENALEAAEWARQNEINAFYLVTAHYHMPRALMEFEKVAPELEIYPLPVINGSRGVIIDEYHKTILTWIDQKTGFAGKQ